MIEKKRKKKTPAPDSGAAGRSADAYDTLLTEDDALPELEEQHLPPPAQKAPAQEKSSPARKKGALVRRIQIFFAVLLVIFLLALAGTAAGGYYVSTLNTSLPRMYIDGVSVGDMTAYEVDEALTASAWDERAARKLGVELPAGVSFEVPYLDSGACISREAAVALVSGYGHSSNWFKDLYEYVTCYFSPVRLESSANINRDYINGLVDKAAERLSAETADKGVDIDEEKSVLRLVKGAGQIEIDREALVDEIESALLAGKTSIVFSALKAEPVSPDFDALYEQLAVEPAEAYFTENFEIVDEVVGCWFNVDRAHRLWDSAAMLETVEIPIELSYPEVTGDALRAMLFRDCLGAQTTYFPYSSDNRISNIALVATKLDGIILMPGETFSFNDTVGQRTAEAGFLSAGAYEDGQVVEALGGGICQVSSTLYCAEMYAQLETVSRTSHYFTVDYLPLGQDATVSWKTPDFKFRNCRDYPVKISAACDREERYITIEIWGTDLDGSYVKLRHDTYTRYDETYPDVAIGYYVEGFRDVYDAAGNLIQTVREPVSDYAFHEEDIEWPEEKYAGETEDEEGGISEILDDIGYTA